MVWFLLGGLLGGLFGSLAGFIAGRAWAAARVALRAVDTVRSAADRVGPLTDRWLAERRATEPLDW